MSNVLAVKFEKSTWLHGEMVYLAIPLLTGFNVEQLRWSRPTRTLPLLLTA